MRNSTLWRLLWTALFFVGCAPSNPANRDIFRRFPIGIYGVTKAEDMRIVREAGFDSIRTDAMTLEDQAAVAQEARRLGLGVIAYPNLTRQHPGGSTSGWPIEAWYIMDEPMVHHMPVATLKEISALTRRWDPDRKQIFAVGDSTAATKYGHIADALMLDWYPIPHLPINSVAENIDISYQALPKGKPLWMIIQAFDWRDYAQRDPHKKRIGRFPSHDEIRYMTYLSIVHGAKGIFYYSYTRPNGETMPERPEHWQALTHVVSELKTLQQVFEKGDEIPEHTEINGGPIETRGWRLGGREYIVLLNKGSAPHHLPAQFVESPWRLLFETKRVPRHLLKTKEGHLLVPPKRALILTRNMGTLTD